MCDGSCALLPPSDTCDGGAIDSVAQIQGAIADAYARPTHDQIAIWSGLYNFANPLVLDGNHDEAIRLLEEAVEIEDGLRYDEPEPLNFSARHWLGAILLEADRPGEAESVFRAALEDHPKNGWSLYGLRDALKAQGNATAAAVVGRELEDAWARSDTWLRGPRF